MNKELRIKRREGYPYQWVLADGGYYTYLHFLGAGALTDDRLDAFVEVAELHGYDVAQEVTELEEEIGEGIPYAMGKKMREKAVKAIDDYARGRPFESQDITVDECMERIEADAGTINMLRAERDKNWEMKEQAEKKLREAEVRAESAVEWAESAVESWDYWEKVAKAPRDAVREDLYGDPVDEEFYENLVEPYKEKIAAEAEEKSKAVLEKMREEKKECEGCRGNYSFDDIAKHSCIDNTMTAMRDTMRKAAASHAKTMAEALHSKQEEWTKEQLADIFEKVMLSGDLKKAVRSGGGSRMIYIPGREAREQREKLEELKRTLRVFIGTIDANLMGGFNAGGQWFAPGARAFMRAELEKLANVTS